MNTVALVECKDDFGAALDEAIELIGGLGGLGTPLVVKPNVCTGDDTTGYANVDVEVVETLVSRILAENEGASLRVVESNSLVKWADEAFERYGYRGYVDRLKGEGVDISLHNLSNSPLTRIEFDGYYFKDPELPSPLADAGGFVNVALAKNHPLTWVTGALKNMFGVLPRKDQSFYHPEIHEVVLDLNRMFRSGLCLIDGRVGLEGVVKGRRRKLGCIILGRNPASVDAVMARVMGYDPSRIRHIVEAADHRLGRLDPVVVGGDVESHVVEFKKPKTLRANAVLD